MECVMDDFFVEDESPEEIRQSLKSGTPVLVIPSRQRRQFRLQLGKVLQSMSENLGRAADRLGTAGGAPTATSARLDARPECPDGIR